MIGQLGWHTVAWACNQEYAQTASVIGPQRGPNAGLRLTCTPHAPHSMYNSNPPRRCRFMSSVTVKALHREFFYNGTRIPDPAPNLTVEQVRELLTPSYPEIATATLARPGGTRGALPSTFHRGSGAKG